MLFIRGRVWALDTTDYTFILSLIQQLIDVHEQYHYLTIKVSQKNTVYIKVRRIVILN